MSSPGYGVGVRILAVDDAEYDKMRELEEYVDGVGSISSDFGLKFDISVFVGREISSKADVMYWAALMFIKRALGDASEVLNVLERTVFEDGYGTKLVTKSLVSIAKGRFDVEDRDAAAATKVCSGK